MRRIHRLGWGMLAALCLGLVAGVLVAQQATPQAVDCSPEGLNAMLKDLAAQYPLDFAAEGDTATGNLYRMGLLYQQAALACGYAPGDDEKKTSIDLTLKVADIQTILQAQSVGTDPAVALAKIADLNGDPSRGQQLYNGLEPVLDGTKLTCSSCHNGNTAPDVLGTWTRIDEIRLKDPKLAGYTSEQYLVESIVHPAAYTVPGYVENLMPDYFGTRIDAQMLADLVAYLDSQDQLLPTPTAAP